VQAGCPSWQGATAASIVIFMSRQHFGCAHAVCYFDHHVYLLCVSVLFVTATLLLPCCCYMLVASMPLLKSRRNLVCLCCCICLALLVSLRCVVKCAAGVRSHICYALLLLTQHW
jgi:hypothetical protein